MREIKFRGKRIDNGEWVHGYIVKVASPCGLGWVMHIPAKDPDDNHRVVQVNPATVGQYTGLEDKNGVEIYEGDKVWCRAGEHARGIWEYEKQFTVEYGWTQEMWEMLEAHEIEVIGNIHDNPELMEV